MNTKTLTIPLIKSFHPSTIASQITPTYVTTRQSVGRGLRTIDMKPIENRIKELIAL